MISDSSQLDGSCDGSPECTVDASMRYGEGELETQSSCSPVNGVSSALPSPRVGNSRSQSALTKKLLNSISAQFRRSLSGMGSARVFSENGKRGRSISMLNGNFLGSKVMQVVERVRSFGYSEEICQDLRNHFSRLPARYTLNIDAQRHEDVLLHMNLLDEAWKGEASLRDSPSDGSYALPQVHVRKVQIVSGASWFDTSDSEDGNLRKAIPIPGIAKPTFGSSTSLAGLLVGSPKVHPSTSPTRSLSTTPLQVPTKTQTPPSLPQSIMPPTFGPFTNPLDMEDDSDQEDSYGYEITLATSDRRGLLKFFTNVLSSTPLLLNIREAHVFSTSDGMALEVFVVEGWTGSKPEDLKQAVLQVLSNQINSPLTPTTTARNLELRTVVEGLAYEDWTVDFKNLEIGERLGGGSSGRLYKGKYLSQEVAIKIIDLESVNLEHGTGSLQSVPAVELLQMFKQEVSIMRLVRHKNLVQFIGACSSWPKLCIVTELMAGGSVRDVIQSRDGGLDITAAAKVLRDAARGMDFLHQRGIVHRDLKAANLLIDEHDVVKVCDFGVARLKPSLPSTFTHVNWAAEMTAETGTYRWMAPEVLEHKPYDHKVDVYSFGIMMWEVLTGEVPYAGLTPLQAAIGVVQRGLRPSMPPSVSQQLTDLAKMCWHEDPSQRPEFSEVVTVLEQLVRPSLKKTPFWKKKLGSYTTV